MTIHSAERLPSLAERNAGDVYAPCSIFGMQNIALLLTVDGHIIDASYGFLNLVQQEVSECFGINILAYKDIFAMPDWAGIVQTCSSGKVAKHELWINSGDSFCDPYHIVITPVDMVDGQPISYFVLAVKESLIEDEKRALVNSAYRDHLTGLFNRRFLEDHFSDFLNNCDETGAQLAVLVIDVNDFKSINDTHGHSIGDQTLRAIAQAIERATPLGESAIRYGGDEFVVVLHDIFDEQEARDIAREIKFEVAKPISFPTETKQLNVSVGISLYPKHGKTYAALIDAADARMYREKNSREVDPTPDLFPVDGVPDWRALVGTHFSSASIVPYFQPIVDFSTGTMRAAEVLCRMRKPDGSLAGPSDFIPVAENLNTIDKIDLAMFDAAAAQFAQNRDLLPKKFFISVNLSAQTLAVPDLPILLSNTLVRHGGTPQNFCIELTETAVLLDSGCGRDNLWSLHEMGFEIALDDFGTGFSSMSLIKDIPVSRVKVDRSFVAGINRNLKDRALVESIVFMSKRLGLTSICEGVEMTGQAKALQDIGADFGQGFLWGRPAPISTLCELVANACVSEP